MKKSILVSSSVIVLLALIIFFSTIWIKSNFYFSSFEVFLFTILMPIEGTSRSLIIKGFSNCLLIPILVACILFFLIRFYIKKHPNLQKKLFNNFLVLFSLFLLIVSCVFFYTMMDVNTYIQTKMNKSTIYERYYVDPKTINYEFPKEKRNLIFICLESMETSFYSKSQGGNFEENIIPELYNLATNNITFTSKNNQGYHVAPRAGYTIGSNVASLCGIPFGDMFEGNRTMREEDFFPGAYGLGDILKANGYNNIFLAGEDAKFASTDNFFRKHGQYEIMDRNYAVQQHWIEDWYFKNWGYEDEALFQFAKVEINSLVTQGKPFNIIISTLDTHSPDGYVCESCPNKYDKQMLNVLSCSSKQVANFVEWVKQQDFYKNTTIVIMGDHVSMSKTLSAMIDSNYQRKPYFVIINSAIEPTNNNNRTFCTYDIFPTTLAALGVKFNSNRLALGTNLFSNSPTLMEELGDQFFEEVSKSSDFYINKILLNKQ